jgi:polysaccharide export outer membrane protein
MREYAGKSESGLYFDGFTVDDHGAIRIPMESNVIGYTLEEIRVRIEKQL